MSARKTFAALSLLAIMVAGPASRGRSGFPRRHRGDRHRRHRRRAAGRDRHGHQHRDGRPAESGHRRERPVSGPVPQSRHLHRHRGALRLQEVRARRERGARRRRRSRVDVVLETGGVEETVAGRRPRRRCSTRASGVSGTTIDASRSRSCRSATARPTCSRGSRRASSIRRTCTSRGRWTTATWPASSPTACRAATSSRIDGAPNMSNARGVGFSPPSDAIAQFKVQTNAFDAQTGHTAGAVVNLALKSGTNAFRGAAAYFNRDDSRVGDAAAHRARGRREADARVQPLHRHGQRPDRAGQDVLHGVVRAPARRAARAGDLHRADRRGCARGDFSEFTTLDLRPAHRDRHQRRAHARSPTTSFRRAASTRWPRPTRRSTRSRTGPGTEDNYFTNQLRPYDYNAVPGPHRPQLQPTRTGCS